MSGFAFSTSIRAEIACYFGFQKTISKREPKGGLICKNALTESQMPP